MSDVDDIHDELRAIRSDIGARFDRLTYILIAVALGGGAGVEALARLLAG